MFCKVLETTKYLFEDKMLPEDKATIMRLKKDIKRIKAQNYSAVNLDIDPPQVIWSLATVSSEGQHLSIVAASASALRSLLRPLFIYHLCVFITYH